MSLLALASADLPKAFKFLGEVRGAPAGEFGLDDDQVVHRYLRGSFSHDSIVSICWSPREQAPLGGVEDTEPIILANGFEYFDGEWAPGPGDRQVDTDFGPIHWSVQYRHSVLARTKSGTFAAPAHPSLMPTAQLAKLLGVELRTAE